MNDNKNNEKIIFQSYKLSGLLRKLLFFEKIPKRSSGTWNDVLFI